MDDKQRTEPADQPTSRKIAEALFPSPHLPPPPPSRPSVAVLRAILYIQAGLIAVFGWPICHAVVGILHDWDGNGLVSELHGYANTYVLTALPALGLCLLAAIHAGRTPRGPVYVGLSIFALIAQVIGSLLVGGGCSRWRRPSAWASPHSR
jgi:hypothetical protein